MQEWKDMYVYTEDTAQKLMYIYPVVLYFDAFDFKLLRI